VKPDLPLGPADIELSSRLLDVTNEAELGGFLRRLVGEVAQRTGSQLTPDAARGLVARLAQTAVQTVPTLNAVIGAGGPAGTWQRESPVTVASRVFGLELEGLSAEDRDYEIARQFVRFAQATAEATTEATGRHPSAHGPVGTAPSGRWVRRGNTIVLIGPHPSRSESHT
jgi:hypothetical protein